MPLCSPLDILLFVNNKKYWTTSLICGDYYNQCQFVDCFVSLSWEKAENLFSLCPYMNNNFWCKNGEGTIIFIFHLVYFLLHIIGGICFNGSNDSWRLSLLLSFLNTEHPTFSDHHPKTFLAALSLAVPPSTKQKWWVHCVFFTFLTISMLILKVMSSAIDILINSILMFYCSLSISTISGLNPRGCH